MLVLTRKMHDEIVIGENVILTILRTHRGSVKIGITAPKGMRVIRGEILEDLEIEIVEREAGGVEDDR